MIDNYTNKNIFICLLCMGVESSNIMLLASTNTDVLTDTCEFTIQHIP